VECIGLVRAAEEFDLERFSLKNLSELEVRDKYQIKISNRLQLWRTSVIMRTHVLRKTFKEIIRISAREGLGLYERSCIDHGLMKNVQDF
jgi:hypothetical protein